MVLPVWRSCFQVGPSCFLPGCLSIQNGLSSKDPLGNINFLTAAWFMAWHDSRKVLFYGNIGQYLPQLTLGVLGRCVVWRLHRQHCTDSCLQEANHTHSNLLFPMYFKQRFLWSLISLMARKKRFLEAYWVLRGLPYPGRIFLLYHYKKHHMLYIYFRANAFEIYCSFV